MISLNPSAPEGFSDSPNAESVRIIWRYVLEKVTIQGGPFGGYHKTEQFEELVDKAVRLFPDGIPHRAQK